MSRKTEVVFGSVIFVLALIAAGILFAFLYPFDGLEISQPVTIENPGKRVPLLGVVNMAVTFENSVSGPIVVTKTLVREEDGHEILLDSSTIIRKIPVGKGTMEAHFSLTANPYMISKRCKIIFTANYNIYEIRPQIRQFETEWFEIYKP